MKLTVELDLEKLSCCVKHEHSLDTCPPKNILAARLLRHIAQHINDNGITSIEEPVVEDYGPGQPVTVGRVIIV